MLDGDPDDIAIWRCDKAHQMHTEGGRDEEEDTEDSEA